MYVYIQQHIEKTMYKICKYVKLVLTHTNCILLDFTIDMK